MAMVDYLGKQIDSAFFRVFVYDKTGNSKLARSWIEFCRLIDSGEYFAKREHIPRESGPLEVNVVVERPKRSRKKVVKDADSA